MESAYVHLSSLAWIWSWSQAGQVWSYLGQCCATLSSTSSSVLSVQCSSTQSHKASGSKVAWKLGAAWHKSSLPVWGEPAQHMVYQESRKPMVEQKHSSAITLQGTKKTKLKFPITVSQHLWGLLNGSVTCSMITSVALFWVSHLLHRNKC